MRQELLDWLAFVKAETYLLREAPATIWQQAANAPDGSVRRSADRRRAERRWTAEAWLRWANLLRGRPACVMTLAHGSAVSTVAVTSRGNRIVSAGLRGVKVWNAESGLEEAAIEAFGVLRIVLTPDDRFILGSFSDGSVEVWDLELASDARVFLRREQQAVWAIALSPDGSLLVGGGEEPEGTLGMGLLSREYDYSIGVWSFPDGARVRSLTGHTGMPTALAVTAGYVFSVGNDRTVRSWSLQSGQQISASELGLQFGEFFDGSRPELHPLPAIAAAPLPHLAVIGGADGIVRLWTSSLTRPIQEYCRHEGQILAVAMTPDGRRIVSAGGVLRPAYNQKHEDSTLKVWDVESGQLLTTLVGHGQSVFSLAMMPDGRHVVSGSRDGTVKVWDLDAVAEPPADSPSAGWGPFALRADGAWLATVNDGIQIREPDGLGVIHEVPIRRKPEEDIRELVLTPDGRHLVMAEGAMLRVRDVVTGETVHEIRCDYGFEGLILSPHGDRVIVTEFDRATVWDLRSGDRIRQRRIGPGPYGRRHVFLPDGTRAVLRIGEALAIWNLETGELSYLSCYTSPHVAYQPWTAALVALSDGRRIVAGTERGTLVVIDVEADRILRTMTANPPAVRTQAVMDDGRTVVSGGDDHMIRVLDVDAGREVARFPCPTDVTRVATAGVWVVALTDQRELFVLELTTAPAPGDGR